MSVDFTRNLEKGMEFLHKQGAFLTVKSGDKVNTMTISWGNVGFMWSRPIFTVMVRKSRYTYDLIENGSEFTVSVPLNKELKNALAICGTKSGRDIDKFKEANLTPVEGRKVKTPVIKECELKYECRVVYRQPMNLELLSKDIVDRGYNSGDYHTLYYGEILDCYLEEK